MQSKAKGISIVIPTYRSAGFIVQVLSNLLSVCNQLTNNVFEIILVDDGSPDNTYNLLQNFVKQYAPGQLKIIRLSRNYGQQSATLCGIHQASYNYILTLDDDYLYTQDDFKKIFFSKPTRVQSVVYGVLDANTSKTFFQRLSTKCWYACISFFSDYKRPGTSFRFFNKHGFSAPQHGAYFNLDEQLNLCGYKPSYVSLLSKKSLREVSNYKTLHLFTHAKNILLGYTLIPSRVFILIGFISALISFAVGLYYLLVHLFIAKLQLGFTALIVTITFSSGLILMGIGVLLQNLRALTLNQKQIPLYVIHEQE